ncbi:GNAT family N-acetyltransferase [Jiangella asiatica]|uniref:GNAT family N-acetyltransferase n=1 Tax=Jiangella asiatica TaxID=2530372 RepID=A0A4R5C6J4_9ACTN|nr:GNAT family N-acetyltransferase [Jiangella asiatica]TDD95391.1 GNAT family N-acetyltransferase [Jiangella asiatica]
MTDFQVQTAQPADFDDIGRITVEAYDVDGFLEGDHDYAEELADSVSRAEKATLLVAAETDGTVLGSVTFCRPGSTYTEISRPGESEFRMLAVAPAARGRGVGAALVHSCVELARRHGDRALVLSSLPRMRTAHRLYERLGFVRLPERDHEPVPGIRLIAYRLSLP